MQMVTYYYYRKFDIQIRSIEVKYLVTCEIVKYNAFIEHKRRTYNSTKFLQTHY